MAAGSSALFRMAVARRHGFVRAGNRKRRIVRSVSGMGITLKLTTAMAASVPNEPIMQFAHVQAGDVFHHHAARFDQLAFERGELHPDHHVARRAVKTAARPAAVGGHDAADGRGIGERRIQWNHLTLRGQQAAQLAVWHAGFHADGQVARLVFAGRGAWRLVEMVILAGGTGPPIRRLEKCPPNSMVWSRADAHPMASASSSGLCGPHDVSIIIRHSGRRQVVQNVLEHGEHDGSEEGRQKTLTENPGTKSGCQLQQEGVQDQPKQAQGEHASRGA